MPNDELVSFMLDTAGQAGKLVRAHFRRIRTGTAKRDRGDLVTQADFESDSYIVGRIREAYPEDGILTEESGSVKLPKGERTWIVDPLDGTRNFVQGIPFFCVSIALLEGNRPIAGAVYDPVHDEMFHAVEGGGAFLDAGPIKVSDQSDPRIMVVNLAWSREGITHRRFMGYAERVVARTHYWRRLGAAALTMCYVASGRMDAVIAPGLRPWDAAAGTLIIREAGGVVSDLRGKPVNLARRFPDVLAANPVLHQRLLKEIFYVG
jgi:myo-inositol-1(or 4)-monophosphatase